MADNCCSGLGVAKLPSGFGEANKPCPAVKTLARVLIENVDILSQTYKEGNGKNFPRLQWRKDGSLNRHDAGLALDIILFADRDADLSIALSLIDAFLNCRVEMQWSSMIYMNTEYHSDGSRIPYLKDEKHFTHIHIDWLDMALYEATGKTSIPWPTKAYTMGFEESLRNQIVNL